MSYVELGYVAAGYFSAAAVEPEAPVSGSGHGFVITDTAPRLWWQRKPKAMPEALAAAKVREIAGAIERIASTQDSTGKQARREIAQAIAPQLEQMPGFDWGPLYRTILLGLHTQQQAQHAAQQEALQAAQLAFKRARDDDDLILLLMAA
jgi:hypothetical protein